MPDPQNPPESRQSIEDRLRDMDHQITALKEARRVTAVSANLDVDPTGRFTGLSGLYKQAASLGVIGVLSMLLLWVVIYEIPGARQKFIDVLLRIELEHREELAKEHDACRGDANLWRSHAQGLAVNFDRQLDRTNSKMDLLAKQIIANQVEIMWVLQVYAPNSKKNNKPMGFMGPPTPQEDTVTRILKQIETLPLPVPVPVEIDFDE